MYRLMHPEFKDLNESPRYGEVRGCNVQAYELRTEVCRSIYTGAKVTNHNCNGSRMRKSDATPSPFLPCCRSLERAVRMRDAVQAQEDAGARIKARFRPEENNGLAVIVRIDIMSMLEESEMFGVIDLSSEEAQSKSL